MSVGVAVEVGTDVGVAVAVGVPVAVLVGVLTVVEVGTNAAAIVGSGLLHAGKSNIKSIIPVKHNARRVRALKSMAFKFMTGWLMTGNSLLRIQTGRLLSCSAPVCSKSLPDQSQKYFDPK